ncbi:MAG: LPS-assembly protein LptD [Chlamydiae bacterium]|nr:LPS-assembly protein LptD [Chlamydiota bacterium]
MRLLPLLLLLFISPLAAAPQQFTINLKDPQYRDGTISTDQGGVITSPELRIQARHIVYINRGEKGEAVHRVIAEGELMVDRGGHTYVGRRLEYDFITKTGIVYDGVTAIDLWFLGGEKIRLNPDKSFYLYNAFVTTSENQKADWKIHSRTVEITKKNQLAAKNVTFRFFETPIFWLPSFKSNLKTVTDSPVRYRLDWDKGLSPKLDMRYRIYSWEKLALFLRFNVRPSKGVGAAFESDYHSLNRRTQFLTRSYVDHDAFYRDTNSDRPRTHYRLQGLYKVQNEKGNTHLHATYDWLSDKNMQTDFNDDQFELKTAKETVLEMRNTQDWMIFGINGRFRVNTFQGMKQELPETFWTPKSFQLGESGIISQNRLKVAYLDYVSATDIEASVPDFNAARLSTHNELYRPFTRSGFTLTPLIGFNGIFYGDSQLDHPVGQAVLTYQLLLDLMLKRNYPRACHHLQPYAVYQGLTHPTTSPDSPYIFSIQDGFNRLNLLKTGVRNLFYFKSAPLFEPNIIADLYAYSFFADSTFKKTVPKIQGDFTWNFPSWRFQSRLGWNIEEQLLDYANIALAWTINENFAFKTEYRHRSRFYWRRDDPNNFIMEVSRDISDLLKSPLSDGRNTLLSQLQIKIAPQWIARIESHIGWGRGKEPNYNEVKVDLITMISTSWRLRITFVHAPAPKKKNDRFAFGLSLVKN